MDLCFRPGERTWSAHTYYTEQNLTNVVKSRENNGVILFFEIKDESIAALQRDIYTYIRVSNASFHPAVILDTAVPKLATTRSLAFPSISSYGMTRRNVDIKFWTNERHPLRPGDTPSPPSLKIKLKRHCASRKEPRGIVNTAD